MNGSRKEVYMGEQLLEEIEQYWANRAEGYSKVNQEELASNQGKLWLTEIQRRIEHAYPGHNPKDISILDIGTGPGFFAIILASAGYQVSAIDYTKAMICQAKKNAKDLAERISFYQMDGQNLTFNESSFHVVLSRNLTWVLENPTKAYCSWIRVLKDNGLFLNFDANWYGYLYDESKYAAYEQDRKNVKELGLEDHYTCTNIDAMETIAKQVPLSRKMRPQWDLKVLEELKMKKIRTDQTIWERVWSEVEKMNYASTPMFLIEAVK